MTESFRTPSKQRVQQLTALSLYHITVSQLVERMVFSRKVSNTVSCRSCLERAAHTAYEDLKMIRSIASLMTRPTVLPNSEAVAGSLSKSKKVAESKRIQNENQRLVDRIADLKPMYQTKALLQEYDKNQRYMVNASYSLRKVCERKLKELNNMRKDLITQKKFIKASPAIA